MLQALDRLLSLRRERLRPAESIQIRVAHNAPVFVHAQSQVDPPVRQLRIERIADGRQRRAPMFGDLLRLWFVPAHLVAAADGQAVASNGSGGLCLRCRFPRCGDVTGILRPLCGAGAQQDGQANPKLRGHASPGLPSPQCNGWLPFPGLGS